MTIGLIQNKLKVGFVKFSRDQEARNNSLIQSIFNKKQPCAKPVVEPMKTNKNNKL